MKSKIKLGKTKDSRIRKQSVSAVDLQKTEVLKEELKSQKEFVQYLLLKGYSTKTTKVYVKDVERFIHWAEKEKIEIQQISYGDILHYIQEKKKQVYGNGQTIKQRTISTNINSIKHYFNYLAITNQSLENPTLQIKIRGVRRKKLYQILSKQELETLFSNFEIPEKNTCPERSRRDNQNWFKASILASKRNKVILGLMIYQALGTTELSRLEVKDIKLREGKIFIAGTRRSNERELKLESHQIMDVMEYQLKTRNEIIELRGKESEKLFVSLGQSDEFRSIVSKLMQKLRKQKSKVQSIQQIRTSVITHWLKIHNLRQVQYMAGHRYVSSTEAYLVNDLDDLMEDIAKYHPL